MAYYVVLRIFLFVFRFNSVEKDVECTNFLLTMVQLNYKGNYSVGIMLILRFVIREERF